MSRTPDLFAPCSCGHEYGVHNGRGPCATHKCTCKRFVALKPMALSTPTGSGQNATPAALYLRVSTREQTVDNQRPDLEQLAQVRGLRIVRVFEEQVSSAASSRPQYEAMLAEAHRGAFHVILVWAIDRFGRSMAGNVQAVIELDRRGVQVVSFREPWLDTGGPVRPLLIAIFSWVAEQERAQLVARTKAGLAEARRKGIRLGRPSARFDLERARTLKARGESLGAIARKLEVSKSVIARALKDRGTST